MTRRERLENKLERRQEWAQAREAQSNTAMQSALQLAGQIPMGQPIHVGHHSEGQARRHHERISCNMDRSIESSNMAEYHREKAVGLSNYLERAIFGDDENAVEALEEKIAELNAIQDHMVAVNKICKSKKLTDEQKVENLKTGFPELTEKAIANLMNPPYLRGIGYLPYQLSNNRQNLRRYQQRLESLKRRQVNQAQAEASESGVVITDKPCGYVQVTFAQKPDRSVLDDLNAADFRWGKGSWFGKKESLPESVKNYQA